jgi:hypothetical protein
MIIARYPIKTLKVTITMMKKYNILHNLPVSLVTKRSLSLLDTSTLTPSALNFNKTRAFSTDRDNSAEKI